MRRLAHGVGAMLFVAFAFATPLGGNAVGRACAAGTTHVAMVIDAGTGGKVSIICMPVGGSDNGATLLAARAKALGTPKPRYNSAGLLCAIDGVPATGCGEHTGGHFAYWSYWHGSNGTWSYSNIGPAATSANPSVVEGWRFQPDGAGLPTDPAPRGPAEPVRICVDTPPPISYRIPTTTVARASADPPTTRAGATGNTTPSSPTAPPPANPGPATTRAGTTATTVTTSAGSKGSKASKPATADDETTTTVELTHGSIASGPESKGSGGAPVGLITGVVLVVAVGAGGAVVARRRRRPAS